MAGRVRISNKTRPTVSRSIGLDRVAMTNPISSRANAKIDIELLYGAHIGLLVLAPGLDGGAFGANDLYGLYGKVLIRLDQMLEPRLL